MKHAGKFTNGHPSWYTKTSIDISKICPCGNKFTTNSIRISQGRGKYCSRKCGYSYRKMPTGPAHPAWKDYELVGYTTIHQWVYRIAGKPQICQECGTTKAKRFEWANISGQYKRDINDWRRLCSPCHHRFDDISNRGWITRKAVVWWLVLAW